MLRDTRERAWGRAVPQLVQLRWVQASEALNRAVALQPALGQAHFSLGRLYDEMGYLDLALHHLRLAQRFGRKTEVLDENVNRLAEAVSQGEKRYDAEAPRLRVQDRALLAREQGLAGKARDLLLASDIAAFGQEGMLLELRLLLRTGRTKDVQEWTSPEHRLALGAPTYHWLRAQALAARGEYGRAEEEFEELAALGRGQSAIAAQLGVPREMALRVGEVILQEQPVGWFSGHALHWQVTGWRRSRDLILRDAEGLRRQADARAFRGLLALEQGDSVEADIAFRLALAVWQDEAAAASGAGLDFAARPLAETCLRWLEGDLR